jgi:hypothetical protein
VGAASSSLSSSELCFATNATGFLGSGFATFGAGLSSSDESSSEDVSAFLPITKNHQYLTNVTSKNFIAHSLLKFYLADYA